MEQKTKDENLCNEENINNSVQKIEQQESADINKVNNENNASEENADEKNSKKNLKFWVGLISAVIILAQFVCYYFLGQEIEIKLVIECISLILAVLVFVGIIKSDNSSNNIEEIKDNISNSITEQIDTLKQKKNKKD